MKIMVKLDITSVKNLRQLFITGNSEAKLGKRQKKRCFARRRQNSVKATIKIYLIVTHN